MLLIASSACVPVTYDVVRLLDDVRVGSFSLGTRHETLIDGDSPEVIREVARAALQGGRTTWAPRRLTAREKRLPAPFENRRQSVDIDRQRLRPSTTVVAVGRPVAMR